MKNLFIFVFVIGWLLGCRKEPHPVNLIPKVLHVDIQEKYVSPPSRVSVFFQVKDEHDRPVANLTPDNFQVYEKGKNDAKAKLISEDEADRIISDNEQVYENHVLLLLDLSASVTNNHLDVLKEAASNFITEVRKETDNSSTKIGIWWFDGADLIHPLVEFTNDIVILKTAIQSIQTNISHDPSTDLYGAVIKSAALSEAKILASQLQGFRSSASVVLFTDGTDQAARYTKEAAFTAVESSSLNLHFYSVGLGNEIDPNILQRIGTEHTVMADNPTTLLESFAEIGLLITNEANSFYLFEYCTPKRDGSGVNELIIEVIQDDRRGEGYTTFNAVGFTSGCVLY